jgi:hypothetical protein
VVSLLAASLASLALAAGGGGSLDEAGYWGFADRLQPVFDAQWDDAAGAYRLGHGGTETTGNAGLLLTHSVAALRGHDGPARQDERARRLVASLFASPPYVSALPPDRGGRWTQRHAPGWVASMRTPDAGQHMAIDAEVIEALASAWLARDALALPQPLRDLIATRVPAVARSRFWRWPSATANQVNWPAAVYSADALITGDPLLLRRDLRRQLARFVAGVRPARGRAGNLGPGLRFHYSPFRPAADRLNVDSAEYGSIVASFTRWYPFARSAGMQAPSDAGRRLLGRWLRRVLSGYWTHGGYLNWDTGLGFRRWHQAQKLGLAQQALIGIAGARELAGPSLREWAKWILDRGFRFYEREAQAAGGVVPAVLFGVAVRPLPNGNAMLGAARMSANAARAVMAGLGGAPSAEPPPLYAFDPDTGRLAVTTPAYSTAVVPVSQGAFPYGGLELARLFDGEQRVAANIGGRPPASFGLLVRDRAGGIVLATQTPGLALPRRRPALRLTRAPAGAGVPPGTRARRAYAGPFAELRATGTRASGGFRARTRHLFTAGFVQTTWSLRRTGAREAVSVDALFPSWGAGAQVDAVFADASRAPVGSEGIPAAGVDRFELRGPAGGYVVVPGRLPAGATSRVEQPTAQSSAPDPGPTLLIGVPLDTRARSAEVSARMAPARSPEEAAVVAAALSR